jgi:hypothetical protein
VSENELPRAGRSPLHPDKASHPHDDAEMEAEAVKLA